MDKKIILYATVGLLILLLAIVSLSDVTFKKSSNSLQNTFSGTNSQVSNSGIPEKCQIPAGQDLQGWKEHLGHHSETKNCLKYFN